MFAEHTVCASLYDHTPAHVSHTEHVICIHRYLGGGSYGLTDDSPFSTPARTIGFRDYAKPYMGIQMPGVSQGVFLLCDQVGYDPSKHDGLLSYAETTTIGRVLNAEFDHFFNELKAGSRMLNARRVQRLIGCLTLAIVGERASIDVRMQAREALYDTVCEYVEQNLASPHLTPRTLLREFGVSRATLFRMFQADGGVRSYITRRRLFRAVTDLASKPTVRGNVSRVAEYWGYSSIPNFNRTVKNMFGVSPGSLFQHPIAEASHDRRDGPIVSFIERNVQRHAEGRA